MVEVIGVLAVIAILAAIAVPNIIKKIDEANRKKELADLRTMLGTEQALERYVLRMRTIPTETNWAQIMANELALPLGKVSTSKKGYPRVFLIDPAFRVGNTNATNVTLPYTQNTNGSGRPISPRIMIVSSLDQPLPITSGVAASANAFNNIWNATEGAVPAGWPQEWAGKGQDLFIQRYNLTPLFYQVIIENLDGDREAYYSIDSTIAKVPTNGINAYFFDGTVLGFHNPTNQQLESREILQRDRSFLSERGIWRGEILEGKVQGGKAFDEAVRAFLAAPDRIGRFGAKRRDVVELFYYYMLFFANWSREGFPYHESHSDHQVPEFQGLLDTQKRLEQVTYDLLQ